MSTLKYLKQALFELKAVKPDSNGKCETKGQFPTPCYNTDGVRSYTCSTSGYTSNKIACDKCDIKVSCPTGNISNSCSGIGGEKCSNSGSNTSTEQDTPTEQDPGGGGGVFTPDTTSIKPNTPVYLNTPHKNWTIEEKEKMKIEYKEIVPLHIADCIVSFISENFNVDYMENNESTKEEKELIIQYMKTCITKFSSNNNNNSKISPLLIVGIVLISICSTGGLCYLYKYIKRSIASSSVASSSVASSSVASSSVASSSVASSSVASSSVASSSAPKTSIVKQPFTAPKTSIVKQPFTAPPTSIVKQPFNK